MISLGVLGSRPMLGTSPTSSQMLRNSATLIDMLHDKIIQLRERVKELEFTNR